MQVLTGATLAAGVQSNFMDQWRQSWDGAQSALGEMMDLAIPTQFRDTPYAYRTTAPYPKLWRREEGVATEGMQSKKINIVAYKYGVRVEWHRDDREDNLVGDVMADATRAGANFASLTSRAFYQILTGSGDLLPYVPNAADGNALFAASRYGVAAGNTFVRAGATAANTRSDIFKAMDTFAQFQNPKGEPLFEADLGTEKYHILVAADRHELMVESLKSDIVFADSANGGAGVRNVVLASGANITFYHSQRIANDDIYVHRTTHANSIKEIEREPLQSVPTVIGNSDRAANEHIEGVNFWARKGFGITEPFDWIKISES